VENTFHPKSARRFVEKRKKAGCTFAVTADVRVAMTPATLEEREMGSITRFIKEDEGADLIEYALLAGLISVAAIATLTSVGQSISGIFSKIETQLKTVNP
jgi:pilus assembly protein Flp/PilA